MLQYASKLPDTNEYAVIWWGQSLATPTGLISEATTYDDVMITRSSGINLVLVGPIAGTGSETVPCTDESGGAITAGVFTDAEIRVGRPTAPGVGYGVITANTAVTVSITWTKANLNLATDTVAITSVAAVATVAAVNHGLATGSQVTIAGADQAAYNGLFTITVTGADAYTYTMLSAPGVSPATGTITAVPFSVVSYLCYRDNRHKSYDNVRVLQSYLPESVAAYPAGAPAAPPGFTIDAAVDDYSKLGLFLPFSFVEGVSGYGISSASGGGAASSATTTTFVWTTAIVPSVLAGAIIRVYHDGGVSWGTITDHTSGAETTSGDLAAWSGVAFDAGVWGLASGWTYDIWLPHWFNSPYELTPGPGFMHPTNESTPIAAVLNVPRGNSTIGWGARWGAMISYAWRVSQAIGKRIHVIPLAVDATYVIRNHGTFAGHTHGWWNTSLALDWNPQTTGALADRIEKLITVVAPAAITADGGTKPLKIIGIAGMQGESEAAKTAGRSQYAAAMVQFYNWLQDTIHTAGLNYFDNARHIPITHPNIREIWETTGGDSDREVNIAIDSFAAKRPYASTFLLDDDGISGDGIHLNGRGEVLAGTRHAENWQDNFEDALSVIDDLADSVVLEICHLALSYVGQQARITSLDPTVDSSAESVHCARVFAPARNMLLQRCAWSFSTRRGPLERTEEPRNSEWGCAYGMPTNAVRLFSILPDEAGDDYAISFHSTGLIRSSDGVLRVQSSATAYTEYPFTVEQDDDGYQVVYTNVEDAIGRWNVLIADAKQFSPAFRNALAYQMASMMAGPILKNQEGAELSLRMAAMVEREIGRAQVHDAIQHDPKVQPVTSWIAARRGSPRRL